MNIKNDCLSLDKLKEAFQMNEINVKTEALNYILIWLFQESNDLSSLNIKKMFEFLESTL